MVHVHATILLPYGVPSEPVLIPVEQRFVQRGESREEPRLNRRETRVLRSLFHMADENEVSGIRVKKTGGIWHGYLDGYPEIDERGLTEEVARRKVERVIEKLKAERRYECRDVRATAAPVPARDSVKAKA